VTFGSLPKVDITAPKGDKSKKWLHALNMTAVGSMAAAKLYEIPKGSTDNPYNAPDLAAVKHIQFALVSVCVVMKMRLVFHSAGSSRSETPADGNAQ
jgi:hypothetical protein